MNLYACFYIYFYCIFVFNPMKYMSPEDMAKMGAAGGMPDLSSMAGMGGVPGMSGMASEEKVKVDEVD